MAEERNTYCQSLGHMNELSWGMNARNEDIKVCARRTEQVLMMSRVVKYEWVAGDKVNLHAICFSNRVVDR